MNYRGSTGYGAGGFLGFPPAISNLVLINAVVFLVQQLTNNNIVNGFALVPRDVFHGQIWQLVTYMFLHGGFMHLFFNMFGLVIFGSDLERWWGSRDFVKYYFVTGIGAGLIHLTASYLVGNPNAPTIGASGSIFGILLAYGMAFPNRQVLLWFVIPVSARTLVIIFGFLELTMAMENHPGDNVARFAHLGGMLVGFVYLRFDTLRWRVQKLFGSARRQINTPRQQSPEDEEKIREEVDRILAKISREGMGSLSRQEKEFMGKRGEEARRRQRGEP